MPHTLCLTRNKNIYSTPNVEKKSLRWSKFAQFFFGLRPQTAHSTSQPKVNFDYKMDFAFLAESASSSEGEKPAQTDDSVAESSDISESQGVKSCDDGTDESASHSVSSADGGSTSDDEGEDDIEESGDAESGSGAESSSDEIMRAAKERTKNLSEGQKKSSPVDASATKASTNGKKGASGDGKSGGRAALGEADGGVPASGSGPIGSPAADEKGKEAPAKPVVVKEAKPKSAAPRGNKSADKSANKSAEKPADKPGAKSAGKSGAECYKRTMKVDYEPRNRPVFATPEDEAAGRVSGQYVAEFTAERNVPRTSLDDIVRYMQQSDDNFLFVSALLQLRCAKIIKGTHVSSAAKAAIEQKRHNRKLRTASVVLDSGAKRAQVIRGIAEQVWLNKGLDVPPVRTASEDPRLSTAEIKDEDLYYDDFDQADVTPEDLEKRREDLIAARKKAQALNAERTEAYAAVPAIERVKADMVRNRRLRLKAITSVYLAALVPHLPKTLSDSCEDLRALPESNVFSDAYADLIYYTKGTGESTHNVFLTDSKGVSTFYEKTLFDTIIGLRCRVPLLDAAPIIGALSFTHVLVERLTASMRGSHDFTGEQATHALNALGEAFYFNDPPADKRRCLERVFGWAPKSDDLLDWQQSSQWAEVNGDFPSRDAVRKASKSKSKDTMFASDVDMETPTVSLSEGASVAEFVEKTPMRKNWATVMVDPEVVKQKQKADAEEKAAAAKKKADAKKKKAEEAERKKKKNEAHEKPDKAPAPKKAKRASKPTKASGARKAANRLATELVAEEAAHAESSHGEARIDSTFFFIDKERAQSDYFETLEDDVAAVRKEIDDTVTVRTKKDAARAFSISQLESNTTQQSAKEKDVAISDEEIERDALIDADKRRISQIAAAAGVPIVAVRNEFVRQLSVAMADEIVADVPEVGTLDDDERAAVIEAAKELRRKTKRRTQTTKKSLLTQQAQRHPEVAKGQLTAVDPQDSASVHGGVVSGHTIKKVAAANGDAAGRSPQATSRLLREIAIAAIDRSTVMTYADVCSLREKLREGEPFTVEDRVRVMIAESLMPSYMALTVGEMSKRARVVEIGSDDAENLLFTLRKISEPGTGFGTWLAKCLVMKHALVTLGQLARTERDSKVRLTRALNSIIDLPEDDEDFSPLKFWTIDSGERMAADKCAFTSAELSGVVGELYKGIQD